MQDRPRGTAARTTRSPCSSSAATRALPDVAGGAHPAGGRRLTTTEIARASWTPNPRWAADQPRQAAAGGAGARSAAAAGARRRLRRRTPDAVPDLQRGLHRVHRRGADRVDLTAEAIRLTRCARPLPDDAEVAGLLALMLLTDARRPARTAPTAAGAAGRAGPDPVGSGRHQRGHRADRPRLAPARGRPLPAPGGDCGRARRSACRRRNRTAPPVRRCTCGCNNSTDCAAPLSVVAVASAGTGPRKGWHCSTT